TTSSSSDARVRRPLRVHFARMWRAITPVAALLCLFLAGFHSKEKDAKANKPEPSLEVPDFDAHDWPDALRLNNGYLNLIVTPSVGRVMRFGFPDAPNVLWTNPSPRPPRLGESLADKPVSPESDS